MIMPGHSAGDPLPLSQDWQPAKVKSFPQGIAGGFGSTPTLHRPWKCTTIEQDILAGYEAGFGAAQECTGEAKLLRVTVPAGGIFTHPFLDDLFHWHAGGFG